MKQRLALASAFWSTVKALHSPSVLPGLYCPSLWSLTFLFGYVRKTRYVEKQMHALPRHLL